jgi:RimJ/RimL family protein N-acetyltransferase
MGSTSRSRPPAPTDSKTNWRNSTSEIGYWISPRARGQGVATAATAALGSWLLNDQDFQRWELKAATGNVASQRVALKSGIKREGVMRNARIVHGGRVDLVLFSLTPADLRSDQNQEPVYQGPYRVVIKSRDSAS